MTFFVVNKLNVPDRAVASMYSWGGVGQKFPNDQKISEYFMAYEATKVFACYPENEDAIYKQKFT